MPVFLAAQQILKEWKLFHGDEVEGVVGTVSSVNCKEHA